MTVALQAAIARNWEKIRQHKPHLAIKPSPPTTHSQSPVMGLFY